MARLGSHFLKKAAAYETAGRAIAGDGRRRTRTRSFQGEALQKMAVARISQDGRSIFGRLQERFPGNELAGGAGLRAGQAYMRAGKSQEAVDAFQRVIAEESYDGPKIRAQAMYWAGHVLSRPPPGDGRLFDL